MHSCKGAELYRGFLEVAAEASPYFGRWTYSVPLVVSEKTNRRLHDIQKIMYKCIRHFVENYDAYQELMPVSAKIHDILSLCQLKPYRPGTYRTDFLIDEANRIKLIEITCRFALNGFFTSGFFCRLADQYLEGKPHIRKIDDYTPYFDHVMEYFGAFDHVCILKGSDNRNETKFTIPIFEKAGFPVHVIPLESVPSSLTLLDGAAVIGELDHDEICSLPRKVIETIIRSNLLNDLRTVFLIHDKRFFSVLGNESFLRNALGAEEIAELKKAFVPTFTRQERPDLWEKAREEKDHWIIKPRILGKSINVFAGSVTDEAEWQRLFSSEGLEEMILQAYVQQRRIKGTVGGISHCDYVVGTLLFFDEHFFGPGLFRGSSFPVTNKVDDRKLAPLVTGDTRYFDGDIVL